MIIYAHRDHLRPPPASSGSHGRSVDDEAGSRLGPSTNKILAAGTLAVGVGGTGHVLIGDCMQLARNALTRDSHAIVIAQPEDLQSDTNLLRAT